MRGPGLPSPHPSTLPIRNESGVLQSVIGLLIAYEQPQAPLGIGPQQAQGELCEDRLVGRPEDPQSSPRIVPELRHHLAVALPYRIVRGVALNQALQSCARFGGHRLERRVGRLRAPPSDALDIVRRDRPRLEGLRKRVELLGSDWSMRERLGRELLGKTPQEW